MPLTYVLAAKAGVVAAAVAAAVARPTKRRRVASDMSTESVAAIITANNAPRIMPTPRQRLVKTEWSATLLLRPLRPWMQRKVYRPVGRYVWATRVRAGQLRIGV